MASKCVLGVFFGPVIRNLKSKFSNSKLWIHYGGENIKNRSSGSKISPYGFLGCLITISSVISGIFTRVLDMKMRTVAKLLLRQMKFIAENGCINILNFLLSGIKESKMEKGGVFVVVDVEKAFDTVPHSSIN